MRRERWRWVDSPFGIWFEGFVGERLNEHVEEALRECGRDSVKQVSEACVALRDAEVDGLAINYSG